MKARKHFRLVAHAASLAFAAGMMAALSACNAPDQKEEEGEITILKNVSVDSVVFWPPTVHYAYSGDTLSLQMRGVQRQRKCKVNPLWDTLSWSFQRDSLGAEYFTPKSTFRISSLCLPDPNGLDTLFKASAYTLVGKNFYLVTPDGRLTDSVLFISADQAKPPVVDTLRHVVSAGFASTHGRFTFRDSTDVHPLRTLEADSLATCEVLQAAVFDRRGDTLVVRARTIRGAPIPVGILPACAGTHADTIEVVPNL
ncbi:MAG TPA: hypothetical protein VHO02_08445, partial [Fibrobacteria bacterium]|nr:hypothetical protein [Fibrobacteria bacterium]